MTPQGPSTLRFSVFHFFFWGSVIMMEGFMVPYLTGIGYSERQIGLVMAALFFVSVATSPIWGVVADRTGGHRWIIAIALAASIGAVLGIRASGTVVAMVVLFSFLYSLTLMSMPALVDSWLMAFRRQGFSVSYEVARGFGSLGYASFGVVLGIVLERFGMNLLFPIYAVVMSVVVVLAFAMPGKLVRPGPHSDTISAEAVPDAKAAPQVSLLRPIVANSRYAFFVLAAFFAFLGVRSSVTFLPLRLYSFGGNTAHVGLAQSVMAASEIPFMFLSVLLLRRFKPRTVILVSLILFATRLVFVRFSFTPGLLVAAQALQGPSVGFFLPAAVHYIDKIAPAQHRSLFQTLAPAIYFGLASVVGSAAGGVLVESRGLDALYTVAPVAAATGAGVFALSLIPGRATVSP